jgi:hypothetical protein
MGSKPSRAMESNRPESGGADHHDQRENSGLLDRDKEAFAQSEAAKRETRKQHADTEIAGEESGEPD